MILTLTIWHADREDNLFCEKSTLRGLESGGVQSSVSRTPASAGKALRHAPNHRWHRREVFKRGSHDNAHGPTTRELLS
jgi:hypothetical protein